MPHVQSWHLDIKSNNDIWQLQKALNASLITTLPTPESPLPLT